MICNQKCFWLRAEKKVEFDKWFDKFKKTLCNFKDGLVKDSFFDAILFGLLFKFSGGKNETREPVDETMGKEFVAKLFSDKWPVQLVNSFETFFDLRSVIWSMIWQKKKGILGWSTEDAISLGTSPKKTFTVRIMCYEIYLPVSSSSSTGMKFPGKN